MAFVYSLAIECKSNEFDGEFFFLQFSSVGCHLPRSQQLIFHFQNSLMWIFFFFAVPWSQLTSISFFNFGHRKEQVWCFQNVTNRQSWCIFLVELSKPYLLNRNAYVLSIQHPRITSLGRCFYANSYTDVSNDIFWNQVRALEKKIISQTNLTLKSNCWQTIGTIKHSWNSAG